MSHFLNLRRPQFNAEQRERNTTIYVTKINNPAQCYLLSWMTYFSSKRLPACLVLVVRPERGRLSPVYAHYNIPLEFYPSVIHVLQIIIGVCVQLC